MVQAQKKIQGVAGLSFRWKDFRSTFAQTCIDNGTKVEAVSRLLGHSSTKITETYYGRIRNDKAMEEVAKALEKQAKPAARRKYWDNRWDMLPWSQEVI